MFGGLSLGSANTSVPIGRPTHGCSHLLPLASTCGARVSDKKSPFAHHFRGVQKKIGWYAMHVVFGRIGS